MNTGEMEDYPNRIRELRGLRGLTADEVARRMGVGSRTVHDWERGEADLTPEQADRLAEILASNVVWMMRLGEECSSSD